MRPSVDRYFMDMCHLVKSRGTCPRRQVGAVIVKDKHVLTTGYNGAPKGFPHPSETGCIREELGFPSGSMADVCPCLHAEQNALIQAATFGVSVQGSDLYCTTQPCTQCSRMIANSGIRRVIYEEGYDDALAIGLLTTAGVGLWRWDAAADEAVEQKDTNTWAEAQDALRRRVKEGHLPVVGQKVRLPRQEARSNGAQDASEPARAGLRGFEDPDREAILRQRAERVKRE